MVMRDREKGVNQENNGVFEKDPVADGAEEDAVEYCERDSGDCESVEEAELSGEAGDRENLIKQLENEKNRAEDYFHRLARMQADFDNYRKRVAKEKEELLKYAGEQVITALLPVLDNLERALAARHTDVDKVYEGVEMIGRQIRDILAAEGLEVVPAMGEEFNPEIHEAVMREEAGDQPENTVLEEMRKGYTLRGKVIRPAMVKVCT